MMKTTTSPELLMPNNLNQLCRQAKAVENMEENTRPLYIRRVPESVWKLVHINAIESRMRLQDYLVSILKGSAPVVKTPDLTETV